MQTVLQVSFPFNTGSLLKRTTHFPKASLAHFNWKTQRSAPTEQVTLVQKSKVFKPCMHIHSNMWWYCTVHTMKFCVNTDAFWCILLHAIDCSAIYFFRPTQDFWLKDFFSLETKVSSIARHNKHKKNITKICFCILKDKNPLGNFHLFALSRKYIAHQEPNIKGMHFRSDPQKSRLHITTMHPMSFILLPKQNHSWALFWTLKSSISYSQNAGALFHLTIHPLMGSYHVRYNVKWVKWKANDHLLPCSSIQVFQIKARHSSFC